MRANLHVVDHPVIQHKLTFLRRKDTPTQLFRALLEEVSMLLAYEVTRDLPVVHETIETPMEAMRAPILEGKKLVLVAVLRAGLGMVDGMLKILPSARVGHVGLYRNEETLQAVEYYFNLPEGVEDRLLLVVDPMLATGGSAVAAVRRIKETNPGAIKFVSLLAAPEGIRYFQDHHPDVPVYTAAVDERLDENGYILPGLGDAGDRLFGT